MMAEEKENIMKCGYCPYLILLNISRPSCFYKSKIEKDGNEFFSKDCKKKDIVKGKVKIKKKQ